MDSKGIRDLKVTLNPLNPVQNGPNEEKNSIRIDGNGNVISGDTPVRDSNGALKPVAITENEKGSIVSTRQQDALASVQGENEQLIASKLNAIKLPDIKGGENEQPNNVNIQAVNLGNIQSQGINDEPEGQLVIPLEGKMITSTDPSLIGLNYRSLKNMRYGNGRPEGILGMTKINTNVIDATYLKTRSAYHFHKEHPSAETHLLVQAFNADESQVGIFDNITAIPSTGDFVATAVYPWASGGTGYGVFDDAPQGQVAYCNGTESLIWGGAETRCACYMGCTSTPDTFKDYTNKMTDKDSAEYVHVGVTGSTTSFMIGSTRPAKGAKIYVKSANASTSTISVKEWTGAAWSADLVDTDGTSSGGKTLAQTGTVAWGTTVATSVAKYIEGYYLYFYLVTISAGDADIYFVSMDIPMQQINDIWDGTYRGIAACYKTTAAEADKDYATNIYEFSYLSLDNSTYMPANIDCATDAEWIELGFTEKMTGLYICLPSDFVNTTSGTIEVYYWNGSAYITVGTVTDGTSTGGVTLDHSGVISWINASSDSEVMLSKLGDKSLYYYKIMVSTSILSTARIFYFGGIPLTEALSGYTFPVYAAERLMLGCGAYRKKNILKISAQNQPDVYNGTDSFEISFGDDKSLTGAVGIFAQYTSNIYNMVLVFKASETWVLLWNQTSEGVTWSRFRISPNIGCPAPRTLCTVSATFENNINQVKAIGIWRGNDGIYLSNGQAPFCVSKDIKDVFDQSYTTHVNTAMLTKEYAFMDQKNLEYHWLWASNSNTTLDKEYVLDMVKWQWFEIDRGSGNRLQCGTSVCDTYGNHYAYGFIDTGYMERLENGNDFDGTDITCTLYTGDYLPEKSMLWFTEINRAYVVALPNNTDSVLTLTHYIDGDPTGTNYTFSLADATNRMVKAVAEIYSTTGIFHAFKFVTVTDDETKGFKPLHIAFAYQKTRVYTR